MRPRPSHPSPHPTSRTLSRARRTARAGCAGSSLKLKGVGKKCDMQCARAVYMNEGPCKAARGVRVLGRPRTFRRPQNRPSPREPIGESNPTASSHTGDGAPARARMRAASVHTRCAWRPGGEDRATKKRAVRVYGTAPLTHDLQVRRKNGGKRRDARPPGLGLRGSVCRHGSRATTGRRQLLSNARRRASYASVTRLARRNAARWPPDEAGSAENRPAPSLPASTAGAPKPHSKEDCFFSGVKRRGSYSSNVLRL